MAHGARQGSQPDRLPTSARSMGDTPTGQVTQQSIHEGGSESRFQAIVELAPDAIVLVDANGRMVFANRQTERMFGYACADLLDRPVELLIPERLHITHRQYRDEHGGNAHTRPLESTGEMFGRRRDGSEFPIEVSLNPLEEDGKLLNIATIRDISAMRQAKAASEAADAASIELRQLLALTDTALTHLTLDDLLRELLARAQEIMRVDNIAIFLLDASGQELLVRAARGLEETVSGRTRVQVGQGVPGRIAASRAPLIVDDVSAYPVAHTFVREWMRSAAGVPLLAQGRLLGVINVGSKTPRQFNQSDIRLLQLMAERITLAIDRAQLHEAAQTARAEAERERARWQAAMDSAPAFVITCDADFHLTYINPVYAHLLGEHGDLTAPLAERPARFGLLRADGSGPITPDETPLARAVREERVIPDTELLYHTVSGEERHVMWNTAPMRAADGSLLGAVSVGWDITEQRRLERAMRDREAQLEAIFEAVADGLAVYDTDGRIVLSNATARALLTRLLPSAPAETLRERWAQMQPTDEVGEPLPVEQWAHTRALRGEVLSGADAVEMYVRTLDGERAAFSVTGAPLRDATGAIVGAVCVYREVTASKRLEREREEAHARELAALEVNRRLDEFLAVAAHDIRNPLTVVRANIQMGLRRFERIRADVLGAPGVADPSALAAGFDAFYARMRDAYTSVERLTRLVNRLFDVTQARTGAMELRLAPCDLAAIMREHVKEQQVAAPNRVIRLELPETQPVPVAADADRLGEVLANYLTNAIKYSPADRSIEARLEVAEGLAVVSVRDEGPGLPLVEQSLVWEMLHRAPGVKAYSDVEDQDAGQSDGLGLGLHICKRIVEAHPGGRVGVESVVGAGSTFWFTLPLASDTPQSAE